MGLLTTAGIWALFVATTLWFPARRGPLGFAVYVVTVACNEIPLVLLAVFAGSIVAIGVSGEGFEGGAATAALVLAILVSLGMVWLQIRARTVRPAMETALAAGLGAAWRSSIRPELLAALTPSEPWLRGILLPFQRHWRTVERERSVPYGPGGRAHFLDTYRRRDREAAGPVMIHLHAGGFVQGNKSRESVALLNQLADHGWFCVSANYRLRSQGGFPASLVDTKRVIAWVRAYASEHHVDDAQIFLMGNSAGGHLAVSAALTAGDPQYQPGFEQADTSVAGVVAIYSYLGPRGSDPASAPVNLARPDAPPILIMHGAKDTAIPPAGPRSVSASLRSASTSPVVYAELTDTQHGFDLFASVRARIASNFAEEFLAWVRSRGPRERSTLT
ncbi:alpha/beta hydrolase [Actinopolymorpha alba]|uniref:alpha/beta hydrolase n=1 Tax=Actinopolymorpha alba TaxID=533267 RepID=UPI000367CE49|nr:alpha/beta hydrolase [Actinopolymorpha alba]